MIAISLTPSILGVDKKDVGMVIHFDISDSLENYVQEAGRAGRDESISADCFVLFNNEDLSKHFILLNQTKLSIQEIQQVWKAIKEITKLRTKVSHSALEIARKAGWDDSIMEIETRVTTAIAALEEAGYLKRGQNMPRLFANSILAKNAGEAIQKIEKSHRFNERQKIQAVRIIKKLLSSRSRQHLSDEVAESRVDYISDHLGIVKEEVIQVVTLLREEKILADTKDLNAFIKRKENKNRSLSILKSFSQLESFILSALDNKEQVIHIKELNEQAEENGCHGTTPHKIKTLLNIWAIKSFIKRQIVDFAKNHFAVLLLHDKELLEDKIAKRVELAEFILDYLYQRSLQNSSEDESSKEEVLVEFSVLELKIEFENKQTLFHTKVNTDDVEDALFYLSRIEALKIEGGFMVTYNALTIERLEQDNRKRYKAEDYQKLDEFYQNKVQQIHIVGEYARKMISNYKEALQFVEDYFHLNYSSFLNKYFKGSRQNEIQKNITPAKFRQLFGELSPTQLNIINDKESKHIVVAAGPGSGKTRILVHKLASLLLMEDVKHEQLLMVTFSRAAATEFKKRLLRLIGNAANFVEIKTFHSYCFDLLGKVGTLEKSADIIQQTIQKIRSGEVEAGRITKTVLVIDEAQDMDENEFELVKTLMAHNEEMRVIAVGDDDQNIYEFRGASSKYLQKMMTEQNAVMYELIENYRSKSNLVNFTNQFVKRIPQRLKKTLIIAVQTDHGRIKLVRHQYSNLITPLVDDILSEELAGTTCVLTRTNDEALQITGLLLKNGMQAKLIQSNEGFNLYNLIEVRFFLSRLQLTDGIYIISDDVWDNAKRYLKEKFCHSPNLELCMNIMADFEAVNPKHKYKSDLDIFIRKSRLEDFIRGNSETIMVSTIHKAKGREFDHVFLMLDRLNPGSAEILRILYVGMTRAKHNLTIHYNSGYLQTINAQGLIRRDDSSDYPPPQQLAMQLTHRDVWLDFFERTQPIISALNSGDWLIIDTEGCRNTKGQPVLKFSHRIQNEIEGMKQKGYTPQGAKVRFIVYWQKEDTDQEIRIMLPEIYFERA